jgi:hypothetical protein
MYDAYGGHAADPYGQAYGQMMPAYAGVTEEVRTIFITGFPLDVKERELNNLLRFLPGYEVRVLKGRCVMYDRSLQHSGKYLKLCMIRAPNTWKQYMSNNYSC